MSVHQQHGPNILRSPKYLRLWGELHEKLVHNLDLSLSEIIANQDLDLRQRSDAGDIQTQCFEEIISQVAATYEHLDCPGVDFLPEEDLQSIQDRISRTLQGSYNERILARVLLQGSSTARQQRPSSPPGDVGPNTMSEDDQCPICYDKMRVKGFTQCEHKVCPPCLQTLVATATTINGVACPLCRQGYPKDVDTAETSRRLESLLQQDAHIYNRETPTGPRSVDDLHHNSPPRSPPHTDSGVAHYNPLVLDELIEWVSHFDERLDWVREIERRSDEYRMEYD
ncbi:hypothetical protein EV426DRAFT_662511 [Tirmania nivea]|nr:hypothetical protein EV426DRAFT_662511 [Tirmania nivea]